MRTGLCVVFGLLAVVAAFFGYQFAMEARGYLVVLQDSARMASFAIAAVGCANAFVLALIGVALTLPSRPAEERSPAVVDARPREASPR